MPQAGHRVSARTRLADVLADIRNSRAEQSNGNQECGPTPAKRRATSFAELNGHSGRVSRYSSARASLNASQASTPDLRSTNNRKKTYNLKLFSRTVDLAPFIPDRGTDDGEAPLYAVCRAWADGDDLTKSQQDSSHQPPPPQLAPSDYAGKQQIRSPDKLMDRKQDRLDDSLSAASTPDMIEDKAPAAEVHRLPSPTPDAEVMRKLGTPIDDSEIDLRIPLKVQHFKPAADLEKTFDRTFNTMARHECLQLNRERWSNARKEWIEANRLYESKYESSFRVLTDIFKNPSRDD